MSNSILCIFSTCTASPCHGLFQQNRMSVSLPLYLFSIAWASARSLLAACLAVVARDGGDIQASPPAARRARGVAPHCGQRCATEWRADRRHGRLARLSDREDGQPRAGRPVDDVQAMDG